MRILHVITTIERGGAENQLVTLVRHQIALGDQVTVAYLKGRPDLLAEFEEIGAKVIRPKNLVFSFFSIARKLNSDFDLAHAHLPRAEILLALSNYLNFSNCVLVASRHNSESFFPGRSASISAWLSRMTLRRYSSVIFISHAVETFLRNSGEIPQQLLSSVIYYGFDDRNHVLAEPVKDLNSVANRYLFVGRLTEQKNIPLLLNAFRRLIVKKQMAELHLYGEGELEFELRTQFQDISQNIFWHGKVSNISDIMRDSGCLILPSKYEGFGLVLIEAMQNALPVIGARNSAIPEVLGEDHPGLFLTEDDLTLLLHEVQNSNFRSRILEYQSSRIFEFEPRKMSIKVRDFYDASFRAIKG